jgi:hypothetical protein
MKYTVMDIIDNSPSILVIITIVYNYDRFRRRVVNDSSKSSAALRHSAGKSNGEARWIGEPDLRRCRVTDALRQVETWCARTDPRRKRTDRQERTDAEGHPGLGDVHLRGGFRSRLHRSRC